MRSMPSKHDTRMPPTCTSVISGTAARFSSSPALVTRENVHALIGSSATSAATEAATDASSHPTIRRLGGTLTAPCPFEQRGRGAERQEESGVAHVERPRADDQRRRGGQGVPGRAAVIEQARTQVQDRHQRRAPHGSARGHDLRVRNQQQQRDRTPPAGR